MRQEQLSGNRWEATRYSCLKASFLKKKYFIFVQLHLSAFSPHLPPLLPPSPWFCLCVLYSSSWKASFLCNSVTEAPRGRALGLSRRQPCQVGKAGGVSLSGYRRHTLWIQILSAPKLSRGLVPVEPTEGTALGNDRHLYADGEFRCLQEIEKISVDKQGWC